MNKMLCLNVHNECVPAYAEQVAAEASAGEEEIIQFLQEHTLVGLLPVPHPSELGAGILDFHVPNSCH